MFDLNGVSINVIEILDTSNVDGAEYFNYFFTIVLVFGMVCFGINLLVKLVSRS